MAADRFSEINRKNPRAATAAATGKKGSRPVSKILLVDDDAAFREQCAAALIECGHRVDTIAGDETGWALLGVPGRETGGYDLVITDNKLPRLSGVGLVKKLHSLQLYLPVVLTACGPSANTESLLLAEWLHLTAVLVKPFSPDRLLQTVNKILNRPACDKKITHQLTFSSAPARAQQSME